MKATWADAGGTLARVERDGGTIEFVPAGDAALEGVKVAPFVQTVTPDEIAAEFTERQLAVFGNTAKQLSGERWKADLIEALGAGTLSDADAAALKTLRDMSTWESAAVEVREAAIAALTPLADIPWPAPPVGVDEFRNNY